MNEVDTKTGKNFTSFFAELEVFPILDCEAAQITGVSPKLLSRYENLGFISRSVMNSQRPTAKMNLFSFYDLVGFEIIRRLHLNLLVQNAILTEILDELLDTFAAEIDLMLSYDVRRSVDEIYTLVASHFMDREREWRQFWLISGERLDPFNAARVCVGIWLVTFDTSTQVIFDFGRRVNDLYRKV